MEQMLKFLSSVHPVTDALQSKLVGIVKHISVEKGRYILRAGEICKNIYFVKKGLVRCYYKNETREISDWFMRENDTFVSIKSFYNQVPGNQYIHTLEDCELYYITYDELDEIYHSNIEFNFNGRVLTIKYLIDWSDHRENILLMTCRERYEELLKNHPDLLQRVKLKYLASYLSMSVSTLSRNRRLSNKKGKKRRR